jgi:lactoylglutathione lyase
MLLGLRTTIYKVADLDQAKVWYSKVLGFPPYFDQPFYVGFSVEGYELGLTPEEKSTPKTDTVSTYWGVDNVSAAYQRLIELGANELEPPQDVGEGIIVAMVKDPWGNPFGIIYNPHFKLPEKGI